MSMSFFSPSLATNISWTGAYSALDPNNLANVANQNKALYLNGSNTLSFGSNGVQQPVITDANGLIPSSLIPSSFDDIREYPTVADFPAVGDDTNGILYYAVDTGYFYKWNAGTTAYINISTVNFYNKTQIDNFLNAKLNKAGDTMTGTLNMNSNNITNGGIFNCTNVNSTSLSSNGYYNSLGDQFIAFSTEIEALKNLDMNNNNILNMGTMTATTSNLGTLGADVNLNSKNLTNGAIITCNNMTCPNIATTTLYDIGGVQYGSLATNTLTMIKPIAMSSNNISGVATLGATTVNTTNLSGHTLSGAVNANSQNISNAGIISASNVNVTSLGVTNIYDLVGNQYAVFGSNKVTMTKPIDMNTQTISGGVLGTMTNNGVAIQYASQLLASANVAIFSGGPITLNLGTAPAHVVSPLWFTGCSLYAQWLSADDWRSIPEYGTTQADPVTPALNFNIRYNSTTRALTIFIPDVNRLIPFNNSGTITAKLYYNLN